MVTVRVWVDVLRFAAFGRPAFLFTFLVPFGRPRLAFLEAFFFTFLLPFGRPAFFFFAAIMIIIIC